MNIMRKGIATETILLLLIGIVVAGILIFMVYRYLISAPLSQEECKARLITWCTGCRMACTGDWTSINCGTYPGNDVGSDTGCAKKYFGFPIDDTAKCKGHKTDCSAFIPV
jgi:hypothetical protein